MGEGSETQLQHGQQAHASGEHLGLVAVFFQELQRLVERAGPVIVECSGNHRSSLINFRVNACRRGNIAFAGDDTLGQEPEQALQRREVVRGDEMIDEGKRSAHAGAVGPVARVAK